MEQRKEEDTDQERRMRVRLCAWKVCESPSQANVSPMENGQAAAPGAHIDGWDILICLVACVFLSRVFPPACVVLRPVSIVSPF